MTSTGQTRTDATSEIPMRRLSTLSLLLLSACELLPSNGKTDDSVNTTEDTATEDTATDPGQALIRFVNLSDGDQARFLIDDLSGGDLYFTQSADYQSFTAGSHDVSAVNPSDILVILL